MSEVSKNREFPSELDFFFTNPMYTRNPFFKHGPRPIFHSIGRVYTYILIFWITIQGINIGSHDVIVKSTMVAEFQDLFIWKMSNGLN